MTKIIKIYDMDGTLVDSRHRYRTVIRADGKEVIDLQYWRDNEYRAYDDSLLPLAKQYQEDLANPDAFVVIATARVINEPDLRFITEKLGAPDMLISRKAGDTRSGVALKIKGLSRVFNLKQFKNTPAIFYEDNKDYLAAVCDHYKIPGVYVPSVQGH